MPAVVMRFDLGPATRNLQRLGERAPVAQARAINRSAMSVRAAAARAISQDIGLRVGTVRDRIEVDRATAGELTARVSIRGGRIPLIDLDARGPEPSRGKGRGVSYRLGPGRRRIPDAFIDRMRSGHRGVFRRVGRPRLPIVELYGPSLPHVFGKPAIVQAMVERYQAAMLTNLEHEIEFELQRLGG